jgi:hypothetical protein
MTETESGIIPFKTSACVLKHTCRLCGNAFDFDEETSIYQDLCYQCAEKRFPLAFAVRKKIQEYCGTSAARDVFTEKHDGCLPDSMMSDDIMVDMITLFKAIGHVVAEAAGLPEDQHTVIVEPSYEGSTWWIVTKNPTDACLPEPARSQIVLFDYVKAWHLGGSESEDDVEEMLRGWKDEIAKSIHDVRLVEDAVQVLKNAKISLLSSS